MQASEDQMAIVHNINGRGPYVEGTCKAIKYLHNHREPGKIFSMIDVIYS